MAKFGAKKKTTKEKVAGRRKSKKIRAVEEALEIPYSDLISSDNNEDQQEVTVVQGKIGTGKSIFAATASEFALKSPLKVKKKWPKLVSLEDMFWLQYDRKALAGLKSLGMKVPNVFDVYRRMGEYGEDVIDAGKRGLELAGQSDADWIVVDTVSTMDSRMLTYHTKATLNHPNGFEAYKRNLFGHALFVDDLISLDRNVIFLTHSRVFDADKDQQQKGMATTIAGGGDMLPDLTGQAAKHYKRDGSLQIVMHAFKDPRTKKLRRQALIGINDQGEGKNRYEGILPEIQEPPHMRALLEMAWA